MNLIEVKLTDDQAEILMVTMLGQCIRFKETDVRPTETFSNGCYRYESYG